MAERIIILDLAMPGDPRFSGMDVECFIFIGHDRRQKSLRIVEVSDNLATELLSLLAETQPASDWRLFK